MVSHTGFVKGVKIKTCALRRWLSRPVLNNIVPLWTHLSNELRALHLCCLISLVSQSGDGLGCELSQNKACMTWKTYSASHILLPTSMSEPAWHTGVGWEGGSSFYQTSLGGVYFCFASHYRMTHTARKCCDTGDIDRRLVDNRWGGLQIVLSVM